MPHLRHLCGEKNPGDQGPCSLKEECPPDDVHLSGAGTMIRTPLCDLLELKYPIFQGGMAWLGTAELASAVSNAGGLGFIGAGNAPGDWVRQQIRLTRERTDRPFGINIMPM